MSTWYYLTNLSFSFLKLSFCDSKIELLSFRVCRLRLKANSFSCSIVLSPKLVVDLLSREAYFLLRMPSYLLVDWSYSRSEVYSVIAEWVENEFKFIEIIIKPGNSYSCLFITYWLAILRWGCDMYQMHGIINQKIQRQNMANLLQLTNEELKKHLEQQKHIHVYGNTNQILYEDVESETFIYYLPAYMQLQFNSISKVDYSTLKSNVYCDINFILNVKGLPDFIIEHLKNNIQFYFNNDDSILLQQAGDEEGGDDQVSEDEDDTAKAEIYIDEEIQMRNNELIYHYLKFNIRKEFITGMVAHVDWTPFQLIDLILSIFPKVIKRINLQEVLKLKENQQQSVQEKIKTLPAQIQHRMEKLTEGKKKLKEIRFYFNLMDCPDKKANTIFYELNRNFGLYAIATKKITVEYSHKNSPWKIIEKANEVNKKLEQDDINNKASVDYNKVKCFECAHFIITLYKIPNSAVATIFMPVLLLCIINLGIFNQDKQLGGRIENLAALMLAFISVFPVIRNQIPPNPKITYMQILIYLLTGTDLLCLIESVLIRGLGPVQNITNDPFFLTTLIVSIITLVVVVILMILHKFKWEPSYLIANKEAYFPDERFDHFRWKNEHCDQHFIKFFDNGRIKASN